MSNPHTAAVIKLLETEPEQRTPQWAAAFSKVIGAAEFEINPEHHVVEGPDGFPYFRFVEPPEDEDYPATTLDDILDALIENRVGLVIFDAAGDAKGVVTLGEILSYKLFGKTEVVWDSPWDHPSDPSIYEHEDGLLNGEPNDELLPGLVRDVLRSFFLAQVEFKNNIPSVTLIRAVPYKDDPTMPSDLVFNVYAADYEDEATFDWMVNAIYWHMPPHLRNRVVYMNRAAFPDSVPL